MKRNLQAWIIPFLAIVWLQVSCSTDKNGYARMKIYLTDAPADVDAVYVDVQEVKVHVDNDWITLANINAGIYNLLDFTNGADTLLANDTIPAGKVSQMRLVLGQNNSIVVDGNTYPLSVPSAYTSGLKFNIHEELEAGVTYEIWIDFDANQSVVQTGNGSYILKPVIHAYTQSNSGAIKGVVLPIGSHPWISAISSSDTLGTFPDANGHFLIGGCPAGSYNVSFNATNYQVLTVSGVTVVNGQVTDMGVLTLQL